MGKYTGVALDNQLLLSPNMESPYINGVALTATAAELNAIADVSYRYVAVGSTLAITAALHANKIMQFDTITGSVATLPVATGTNNTYHFQTKVLATSNSHIVKVANGTDVMSGSAIVSDNADGTATVFGTVAASDTVTFNRGTTGSVRVGGDWVTLRDVAAGFWSVEVRSVGTGGEATPFSATV